MTTDPVIPNILLVMLPSWTPDGPPLGLGCISEYIHSKGLGVQVLDLNIDIYNRVSAEIRELWKRDFVSKWWVKSVFDAEIKPHLQKELDWAVAQILSNDVDTLGFSVYGTNRLVAVEVIREVKRRAPHKKIIIGGRGVYDSREREFFAHVPVDYFIVGEGEETLYQLLLGNTYFPGIIPQQASRSEISPFFMTELKDMPSLIYRFFNVNKYAAHKDSNVVVSLLLSRGCILKCAFCGDWRNIGKLRSRKAESVFEAIQYLRKHQNITDYYFNDQALNSNLKELDTLCRLLIDAPFTIQWQALAIPVKSITYERLVKMKQAGCKTIGYGVESGSDKVLALMKRRYTTKEAAAVLKDTKRAGIECSVNFVIGFPGETEEDFNETMEFVKNNRDSIDLIGGFNICSPVLGSDLFIEHEMYGIVMPKNMEGSDVYWYTADKTNTYAIRVERYNRLLELLRSLQFEVAATNIDYGDGIENN